MSKHELIDRIMRINQSARREFLAGFTVTELYDYLRQLEGVPNLLEEVAPEPRDVAALSA